MDFVSDDGDAGQVVDLTQRLVRLGAMSGEEARVADLVEAAMNDLGYRDISRDRLGNVVGLVGPRGTGVALLFDSHMDVVPATGKWSVDPFGGELKDGKIFGRGTTDMKGALAASLIGVAAAAREGRLAREVAVSASVLEETIEGAALSEVLERIAPERVVICEPSSLKIMTSQRGRIEILLDVFGVPAHAAHPEKGKNALYLAAQALDSIRSLELPDDPLFGRMIIVPTDIVSNPYPSISALPDRVSIRFDRRIGVGETLASVLKPIQDVLDPIDPVAFRLSLSEGSVTSYTGETISWPRFLPAWAQDRDSAFVRSAVHSIEQTGMPPQLGYYAFCTNGSESAGRRNIPTIGLGPGSEDHAHIIDEYIAVDQLIAAVEIYRNLTTNIAGEANAVA